MSEAADDPWAPLVGPFVDGHYTTLRGRARTELIDRQLRWHLPSPPASVVDIGGGAGHQSVPLARSGYSVTIVDPSSAMLDRAEAVRSIEPDAVAERIQLVRSTGEDAPTALGGNRYAGVLCHGVIMYVDDPAPLVASLAQLAEPGGVVSIAATNARSLAVGPALAGRWEEALVAFDRTRHVNGLGVETRADTVEDLSDLLAANKVDPIAWYGVRLFTDGWGPERPAAELDDAMLAVELEAGRRDPYRLLSRLFHLVGRRRPVEPAFGE